jgi:Zn-dependent peptidase ImmA (M78 family)
MTRPRIEINTLTDTQTSHYDGPLEKPVIYLGMTDEYHIFDTLEHEYIHWVLHKIISENACFKFNNAPPKEYR